MPPQNKITNVVHTLLDGLHTLSKSETVIGDAYTLGEATLVPVHRVRVGLGAGTLQGDAKQDSASGESGGQGAGGAVQIEPVAVIAVGRDGVPRIMCVESEESALEGLLRQLPDVLSKSVAVLSERLGPLVDRSSNRGPAVSAPAKAEALPQGESPMLTK